MLVEGFLNPFLPFVSLRISVSASTANLGPGFDIWGIALELRNEFICDRAKRTDGSVKISFAAGSSGVVTPSQLPKRVEADNLFIRAYSGLMKKAGQAPQSYDVQIVVNVPFSRGLGSSSTAILAGLTLANETLRRDHQMAYRIEQLMEFALEYEPHPDNLTAALYGGWNLCLPKENPSVAGGGGPSFLRVPMHIKAPVKLAGIVPDLKLETRDSRQLIPVTIGRPDLIFQTSRVAALVHLLNKEDLTGRDQEAFRAAIEDKMHTTQRSHLIPGMFEIFEDWYAAGAMGCFLSGAGSTLLAFWPRDIDTASLDLGRRLREKKIQSVAREFQVDQNGLMVLS